MRHEKRLNSLIDWLTQHKQKRDVDPITLAAIAHYGIVRFLIEFIIRRSHFKGLIEL
jgi:prolipoprotein diacylglyceryltransferase